MNQVVLRKIGNCDMKQRQNKSEKVKSCRGSTTKGARGHRRPKHGIGKLIKYYDTKKKKSTK